MKSFLQSQENHKDILRFSFTKEEVNQMKWEEDQEFRYNDEMYDVIEKKLSGNRIIIYCIADKKETNLLQEYQKNNRTTSNLAVVQLITANFILPGDHFLQQPVKTITKQFIRYSSSLQKLPSKIFPPPPDVC